MPGLELLPEEAATYEEVRREVVERLALGNVVGEPPGHRKLPPPANDARDRDPAPLPPAVVRFAEAVHDAVPIFDAEGRRRVLSIAEAAAVAGLNAWTAKGHIRRLKDARLWPYLDANHRGAWS